MTDRRAGFTLIELLVVIGILSLLMAAFLPDIFRATQTADKAADQANLRWHYLQLQAYKDQYKALPARTGHKFVMSPWVKGVCQRTPENFERFWVPGAPDPRKEELKAQALNDPDGYNAIWRDLEALTSQDTHYAGPGPELVRKRLYGDGELPMMADDNEFVPLFKNNLINVLMGNSAIRELNVDPDFIAHGFNPDAPDAKVEVGPNAMHPLLQKLEH